MAIAASAIDRIVAAVAAPARAEREPGLPDMRLLLAIVVVAGALYGAVMGTFSFTDAQRLFMVLYAAIKVPVLICATTLVCLPAFFVLNTVAGLRDDFGRAMRAVLASQGAFTLALVSIAPITRFFYFCGANHRWALLFNAGAFTVATGIAQVVLVRRYRGLVERAANHRAMLVAWVVMYAFVGIQMGWMMRPFVGDPSRPVTFFREEPFSNAYVVIVRLILGT